MTYATNAEAFKALKARCPCIWKELPNHWGDTVANNCNGYYWGIEYPVAKAKEVEATARELGIVLRSQCVSEIYGTRHRIISMKKQAEEGL
jgi:hypothetical protein